MYRTIKRLDIMYAISLGSRYMDNPTRIHLLMAKRTFQYLKVTISMDRFI
jgi:hypothetical protein